MKKKNRTKGNVLGVVRRQERARARAPPRVRRNRKRDANIGLMHATFRHAFYLGGRISKRRWKKKATKSYSEYNGRKYDSNLCKPLHHASPIAAGCSDHGATPIPKWTQNAIRNRSAPVPPALARACVRRNCILSGEHNCFPKLRAIDALAFLSFPVRRGICAIVFTFCSLCRW